MHQPATRRLAAWASAVVLALGVASCSGGDDADPLSTLTDPPTTTTTTSSTSSTSTTAVTTTQAPDTTATAPPTTPAPTTTTIDDLKAQIAADYVRGHERVSALLAAPAAEGLDEQVATFAVPGSPYFEAVKSNILDHVRLHEVTIPGDPPYNSVTVESIEFEGTEPYVAAMLTVCRVENLKRVLPAAASPVGEDILVYGGELNARRYQSHVVLTASGWLRDEVTAQFDETYVGATECGVRS